MCVRRSVVAICMFCDGGDSSKLGPVVYSARHFALATTLSYDVPGWMVMWSHRHAEGAWGLNEDESEELGPLITAVAGRIRETVPAAKLYFSSIGENNPHFHMFFAGIPNDVSPAGRG